jgi:signal transduction histidine kinase
MPRARVPPNMAAIRKHGQARSANSKCARFRGPRLATSDDGIGGADPARGSGLTGLRDRIEAVGGTLGVTSPDGGGTTLLIPHPGLARAG